MPDQPKPDAPLPPKKIPTEVWVALFGFLGVIVTAYFGYLQARLPYEAQATKDAQTEAAGTALARTQTALAASTPTPTASRTPSPVPATATATATASLTPTAFGVPAGERYCVDVRSVYVRAGPGSGYPALGGLTFEDCPYFDARAQNRIELVVEGTPAIEQVTWLRLSPSQTAYAGLEGGWVRADLLRPQDYDLLPVITLTPTVTPSPEPTGTPTPLG